MRNIALTFLGCFTILAACSNSDDAEKPVTPVPTGDVTIYATTSSLTRDLTRDAVNFSSKDNLAPTSITLNPTEQYQTMDGFGAAITGATCFNLLQMKPEDRHAFLTETFSDDKGFGFSYIRISIGCSDFSLSEYTCCDTKGIEHFALQSEEKDYILPILKEILSINPSIKVIAAPWTCPKWMKVKSLTDLTPLDSWTNGQLNPAYYQDYATYFVKWVQAFNAEGIDIYAVTPQNEPLNRGNSASLYMSWEEQRWLIKTGNLQEQISRLMNRNPKSVYRREVASAQDVMRRYSITALPVLNSKGIVIDILFEQEQKTEVREGSLSLDKVPVVIMAGGKGTRLYPYTKILPKPLIPIGDIPIMERIIDKFRDVGVTDFYATVNYRKNMIKSYFTDTAKDYEIKYVEENQPLGTAGSLRLIEEDFEQPFIVTNCDILIHADYEDIYRYHRESGNELTIVSALKNIVVPYGVE